MTSIEKRALVYAYADAFNRGDIEGVCRLFAPDALVYGVLGWGDMTKVRPIWEQITASFKMNLQLDATTVEDDVVAARYTERGTFVAPFRGTEPTGKSYEVVAMEWFVLKDGLIHRRWGARDSATIFRQMGVPLN
ncbi:MAG TPA: ester cyclase [Candidatus Didemnitutus sp.]|nr:ester cyclase [Candidatus Didemnitutus sp.]